MNGVKLDYNDPCTYKGQLVVKSMDPYVTSITSCGDTIPTTTTNFGNQTMQGNFLHLTSLIVGGSRMYSQESGWGNSWHDYGRFGFISAGDLGLDLDESWLED